MFVSGRACACVLDLLIVWVCGKKIYQCFFFWKNSRGEQTKTRGRWFLSQYVPDETTRAKKTKDKDNTQLPTKAIVHLVPHGLTTNALLKSLSDVSASSLGSRRTLLTLAPELFNPKNAGDRSGLAGRVVGLGVGKAVGHWFGYESQP